MIDLGVVFSQVWFLIPLLIVVALIKIFFQELDKKAKKKRYITLMEENKIKGKEYEQKSGRFYEEDGYFVDYNGIVKNLKDGGIDLICSKDSYIKLLVQCKNYREEKSINHEMIKVFHSNATRFMDLNGLSRTNVELKYVVPNVNVLIIQLLKYLEINIINADMKLYNKYNER